MFKFILLGALVTSMPASLFAHAHLTKSEPSDQSKVSEAPLKVILHFSEDLEPAFSQIEVNGLESGQAVTEGKSALGNKKSVLEINLKAGIAPSAYHVKWKAVAVDTHKMLGEFDFTYLPKK